MTDASQALPSAWLFQANPSMFDIDGLLATNPDRFYWRVNQGSSKLIPGAVVYIWRSIGGGPKDRAGIIAECEVVGPVAEAAEDPASIPFWIGGEPHLAKPRVLLRLIRRATSRSLLKYAWLEEDPVAWNLPIFRQAQATNFALSDEHATRLSLMWSRVGVDWTYAEAVAGLWAFDQTYNSSVSKLPGSPVSRVSELTGRSVSGSYNKVMNFRSLDPRDPRKGFDASAEIDKGVWAKFFDPSTGELTSELQSEFERLWGAVAPTALGTTRDVDAVASELAGNSLDDLMARYASRSAERQKRGRRPRARATSTTEFDRDPLVVAIARLRARRLCEIPGCNHPTFQKSDGEVYVEVHHILPLEKGGADTIENVACLCPAHHCEAHHGKLSKEIAQTLFAVRAASETAVAA